MALKKLLNGLYEKLVIIDDSHQKIALGFGLGVFLGIIPGAGPLISLALAAVFRINRAAALIGCLVTNTWISFAIAILAVKTGAFIFRIVWQELWLDFKNFIQNFSFSGLFNLAVLKILLPVIAGYLIIGVCIAFIAYLLSLFAIKQFRQREVK